MGITFNGNVTVNGNMTNISNSNTVKLSVYQLDTFIKEKISTDALRNELLSASETIRTSTDRSALKKAITLINKMFQSLGYVGWAISGLSKLAKEIWDSISL